VNLSAKTEYACIAVLELAARRTSGEPVRIRDIADRHGVPSRFLVQILLQLKGAGIVTSTRGASGGYQLGKDPERITLAEVMSAIEGPANDLESNCQVQTPSTRTLLSVWREAAIAEQEILTSYTFADLAARARQGEAQEMYYI
jgi:Rrf2 family protein